MIDSLLYQLHCTLFLVVTITDVAAVVVVIIVVIIIIIIIT
jgi:hypothetical protein